MSRSTIFWLYHVTMLNACPEAHALAPLRFARAVEMWYFGSLASGSPIRQAGTRTGTTSLNWDLHYNQEFPVRFGCCKRQSWSTRWVDQQYFDCTTWPCLTHALRPTHSLRFASLVLWKCGILGVLLPEARSDRVAQELGRPVPPATLHPIHRGFPDSGSLGLNRRPQALIF